jgi:hypothetical protein
VTGKAIISFPQLPCCLLLTTHTGLIRATLPPRRSLGYERSRARRGSPQPQVVLLHPLLLDRIWHHWKLCRLSNHQTLRRVTIIKAGGKRNKLTRGLAGFARRDTIRGVVFGPFCCYAKLGIRHSLFFMGLKDQDTRLSLAFAHYHGHANRYHCCRSYLGTLLKTSQEGRGKGGGGEQRRFRFDINFFVNPPRARQALYLPPLG